MERKLESRIRKRFDQLYDDIVEAEYPEEDIQDILDSLEEDLLNELDKLDEEG